MRVNSVENNSPRFKALKVSNSVKPLIEKESIEFVQNLKKLGERVKDFKHYDVVFKDDLIPKIYAANANINKDYDYYRVLRNQEKVLGRHYEYGDEYERYGGWHPDQPQLFIDIYGKKGAVEKYNEFKKLNGYDRVVEYCRMLNGEKEKMIAEELALKAEEEAKLAAEKAKQEAFENELNGLYEGYGYEEPVEVKVIPENENVAEKKGLFAKIKSFFKK